MPSVPACAAKETAMAASNGAIKLVAGNSNPKLAEAIASYLSSGDESDELARFRAAIDAVGERPIDLPDGQSYVEAIRAADADRDEALEVRRERPKRRKPR